GRTRAAGGTTNTGMAELVVGRALLIIGQHFISLGGFLETRLGGFVARITIRVVLHRQTSIRFLDLVCGRAFGYAQSFVIVSFRHAWSLRSKRPEQRRPPPRLLGFYSRRRVTNWCLTSSRRPLLRNRHPRH